MATAVLLSGLVATAVAAGALVAVLAVAMFFAGRARAPDAVAFPPPREAAP